MKMHADSHHVFRVVPVVAVQDASGEGRSHVLGALTAAKSTGRLEIELGLRFQCCKKQRWKKDLGLA
jgi:hypothetical protein